MKSARGFTLIEIMIVIAVIGIVVGIAAYGAMRARNRAQGMSCNENLSKIEWAKEQYALENNVPFESTEEIGVSNLVEDAGTGYLKKTPACPGGGAYTYGDIRTLPTCDKQDEENGVHILPG